LEAVTAGVTLSACAAAFNTVMAELWTAHSPFPRERRPGTWHVFDDAPAYAAYGPATVGTRPAGEMGFRSVSPSAGFRRSADMGFMPAAPSPGFRRRAGPPATVGHVRRGMSPRRPPRGQYGWGLEGAYGCPHEDLDAWDDPRLLQSEHYGPHSRNLGERSRDLGGRRVWHDAITAPHNPYEDVVDSPGLVHAWEKHHVLSWLHSVGLGDTIANFKKHKFKGDDLLKLTPKNVAEHLGINDGTTTMRILERVMPLKEEWKAARQAAGLKTRLDPADPDRPKRLVAELHVLIYGLSALPPGASGAYVLLELGDHAAKSTFVPSSAYEAWYYEGHDGAMFAAGGPNFPTTASSFVHRPTDTYNLWPAEEARNEHGAWPQTFKLTIDDDIAKDKDKKYGKIFVDVVAWFPQVGELSLGCLTVEVPDKKTKSHRMRFDAPLKAELHWKAFGDSAVRKADAWEKEEDPVMLPPGSLTSWGTQGWVGASF